MKIINPNSVVNVEQLGVFKTKLLETVNRELSVCENQFLNDVKLCITKAEAEKAGYVFPSNLEFPAICFVFNKTEDGDKSPMWVSLKRFADYLRG